MKTKVIVGVIFFLIFINLPFWSFFLSENFCYQNIDGSFNACEEKGAGSSYAGCMRQYGAYLKLHQDNIEDNNKLYRTFTIKPWRFWEWREMIFHSERFYLPYLDPEKKEN